MLILYGYGDGKGLIGCNVARFDSHRSISRRIVRKGSGKRLDSAWVFILTTLFDANARAQYPAIAQDGRTGLEAWNSAGR